MYYTSTVRIKSQLGWLNLPHLPIHPPPVTAKHRMVIIPGDQPEEGIDGYGRNTYVTCLKKHRLLVCKITDEFVSFAYLLSLLTLSLTWT